MYGHHVLYRRVIWINRVMLPSLLVVSSTGKLSVLADASVVNTYIYMYWYSTAVCICLYARYIYNLGTYMYIHARFTAVYCIIICIYV